MEHTEGVKKLNFVLSLTDAILEVISARGTPFTVLTDSVAIKQVCTCTHLTHTTRGVTSPLKLLVLLLKHYLFLLER